MMWHDIHDVPSDGSERYVGDSTNEQMDLMVAKPIFRIK
jgi:hypothetical protein